MQEFHILLRNFIGTISLISYEKHRNQKKNPAFETRPCLAPPNIFFDRNHGGLRGYLNFIDYWIWHIILQRAQTPVWFGTYFQRESRRGKQKQRGETNVAKRLEKPVRPLLHLTWLLERASGLLPRDAGWRNSSWFYRLNRYEYSV